MRAERTNLQAWIGRVEERDDLIPLDRAKKLAATLDLSPEACTAHGVCKGGALPPLWHWIGFVSEAPHSALGPDGHPARGGFLPPVPLERRMWAGGRLSFHRPIPIGKPVRRRSEILAVKEKVSSAGAMVLVTVAHSFTINAGLAVEEEHDIAYVAIPERFSPPPPLPAPAAPDWEEHAAIDPVLLFRYSAVTFNAHRIHYDLDYARTVERYPGLVVHGPLQALLLVEAARKRKNGALPAWFRFRAVRPLFHTDGLRLIGKHDAEGESLFAVNRAGEITMQASIGWHV